MKPFLTVLFMIKFFMFFNVFSCFSQNDVLEINPCITLNVFEEKCESALVNLDAFMNGSDITQLEKQNIINCYNQLKCDFVGEDISRLRIKNDSINKIAIEKVSVNTKWKYYFNEISLNYENYTLKLIDAGESYSYGNGGALYFNNLAVYPIEPMGRGPFVICK